MYDPVPFVEYEKPKETGWVEYRRFPNPKPKATPAQIKKLRSLRAKGMTCREIGEAIGLSFATVCRHSKDVVKRKKGKGGK